MKKLTAFLLAATMIFSLAACGDKNSGGGKLPPAQTGDGSALSTDFQQHMKTADSFRINAASENEQPN